MTSDEYATLMDFLATRFARMDARQEAMEARQETMEARLTRAEVLWESMRDDLRRVAEGVVALSERMDRRFATIEGGLGAIQVQFDRFAVDFGTVQLDHGARMEALERHRRRRGPGG